MKVAVVGAGPVGSLAALYAAQRGDDVEVYELRGDLRGTSETPLNFTKSINLALSERGIYSIRQANCRGLIEEIYAETIPMYGRMIHGRSATGKEAAEAQAYDVHGRAIRAIDRGALNKSILDALGALPNVRFFFHHKLVGADFRSNKAWFEKRIGSGHPSPDEVEITFDLMIGADGAHSATRYHMMKFARMNYEQEYIDTLWCEFTIPPSGTGDFCISPNHLHIWPGGNFMFIAIPSLNKSFTCTLFAPSAFFTEMESSPETKLVSNFEEHFPGIVNKLISEADMIRQFQRNPHLPLINIKCAPHHYGSSVVIVGDAANAMVPFYGQGMNAGLESVRVLFEHLDKSHRGLEIDTVSSRRAALSAYTLERVPDAHSIATLALKNYVEMRASVRSPWYKLRKLVEESLDRYTPRLGFATQYSRISFGKERYSIVEQKASKQRKILAVTGGILATSVAIQVLLLLVKVWQGFGGSRTNIGRFLHSLMHRIRSFHR